MIVATDAAFVPAESKRRRFTAAEVMRMVEVGILGEDDPLELLDGELIEVSPQGPRHISLKDHLRRQLDRAFASGAHVRDQGPLDVGQHSLPEPDLAVIRGLPRDYLDAHPQASDALLVVELAVTSQVLDHAKAALYSRRGVAVYWLLDVPARRLHIHESPASDGRYRRITVLADSELAPLPGADTPDASERGLPVADMLP
ncbi:MAG: Uma2 family endonuclease [Myxococcota bacterium]